jgi:hypothetical protein
MSKFRLPNRSIRSLRVSFGVVVLTAMIFVLGILIGQRNFFNQNTKAVYTIQTEIGSGNNILSELKTLPIWGISDSKEKSLQVGSFTFYKKDKSYFQIFIDTPVNLVSKGGLDEIPNEYKIIAQVFVNGKVVDTEIGALELKKGNNLNVQYFGEFTNALQPNQIVLKVKNKEEEQNKYLYNDKMIPTSLNNSPMPFFWIKF